MTRPSVVGLVFFTGVPALAIDTGVFPSWSRSAAILLGVALCAAASSVFNAWIERDVDGRMARTRNRPLPTGQVTPNEAMAWAWLLTVGGIGMLAWQGGAPTGFDGTVSAFEGAPVSAFEGAPVSAFEGAPVFAFEGALAGALTIAYYVFVYTIWLKPRTPLNIVIGGAAGAAPPLIVDACLTGGIGLMSLTLFLIVFLWTPPHFWAISLFRKSDYAAAGFPMLPITHGDEATRWRMVLYALSIVPFAALPALTGHLSVGYGLFAVAISLGFTWTCLELLRGRTDGLARRAFFASLVYLHLLFTGMTVDLVV